MARDSSSPPQPPPPIRRPQAGLRALRALLAGAAALAPVAGCRSAAEHAEAADEEVYGILDARRAELGFEEPFSVEPPPESLRDRLLAGEVEHPIPPLTLVDALRIAAESSREFQTRREVLYLTALDLTRERWELGVKEQAGAVASASGAGEDTEIATVGAFGGLSKLFASGAFLAADLGLDLVKGVAAGDPWRAVSSASLSITQPLLRGFGSEIVLEPLTQAERDVLYEVRSFERFRRTLAFDVTRRYTTILQQMDVLANEIANQESLVVLRERNEALGEAGRLSDIQVDQARQQALQAANSVVEAQRSLQASLDDFKLFLGLPLGTEIAVEPGELDRLFAMQLSGLDLGEEEATAIALRHRLDHQNARGRVEDRVRRVRVAADDLRPGLDLELTAAAVSDEGQPLDVSGSNVPWSVALILDLPVDRLPDRNAHRAALIDLQAEARELERSTDVIRADVRDAMRELAAARETLSIQELSVELAERRVEITQLNLEAGRAETRDVLEAQEDLVSARNAATRARIDLTIAQLALFRDMELLRVDERGLWYEAGPLFLVEEPPAGAGEARP